MKTSKPVHYIDVKRLSPNVQHLLALLEEKGEICGEDRGSDHAFALDLLHWQYNNMYASVKI